MQTRLSFNTGEVDEAISLRHDLETTPRACSVLENWRLTESGAIERRGGMVKVADAEASSRLFPYIYSHVAKEGLRYLVEVTDTQVKVRHLTGELIKAWDAEEVLGFEPDPAGESSMQLYAMLLITSLQHPPFTVTWDGSTAEGDGTDHWTLKKYEFKCPPWRYNEERKDTVLLEAAGSEVTNVEFHIRGVEGSGGEGGAGGSGGEPLDCVDTFELEVTGGGDAELAEYLMEGIAKFTGNEHGGAYVRVKDSYTKESRQVRFNPKSAEEPAGFVRNGKKFAYKVDAGVNIYLQEGRALNVYFDLKKTTVDFLKAQRGKFGWSTDEDPLPVPGETVENILILDGTSVELKRWQCTWQTGNHVRACWEAMPELMVRGRESQKWLLSSDHTKAPEPAVSCGTLKNNVWTRFTLNRKDGAVGDAGTELYVCLGITGVPRTEETQAGIKRISGEDNGIMPIKDDAWYVQQHRYGCKGASGEIKITFPDYRHAMGFIVRKVVYRAKAEPSA